ncbi:MAG: YfhO family protein [Taibaiella sp.]|nr:YfhO family protein [Taibaiella sp.]
MSSKKRQHQPDSPKATATPVQTPITETTDFLDTLGSKAVFILLGLLFLMAFVVYKDYLLFHNAYFFKDIGSDSYNYSYAATYGVADYIARHGMPGWSFNMGMGQSIFPFFLRDPFDIFLYMGGKDNIVYATAYKEFAKVILSGLVFYYYLKALNLSSFTSVIGSLFFAFCGFMILGGGWYFFSFEAFNLAVLLLAFEHFLSKGKWYLFPVGIALIAMSQPFNLYVYGLFLAGYTALRLVQTGNYNLKTGSMFLAKLAGLGALGLMLAGPFLLENVVQLLESPRGSGNTSYAGILSSVPVFGTVDMFQFGTAVMRFFSSDILGAGTNFKGWQNTLEAPLFYCGLPCLLLMPQVFPFLEKRIRLFFILFLAIWFIPVIFPYFRYAFWLFTGDYYRAYSIVLAMFVMYYSLLALDNIIKHRKINLIILLVTVAILFLLLNYPFFPDTEAINSPVFTFVSLLLLVYAALLYFMGRVQSPAYLKYVLLGVVALELMYMSGISVNDRDPLTAEDIEQRKGYNDYTMDAIKFINNQDKSFFRIDKSYASSPAIHYSLNDALAQEFRGTSGYNPFNQLYYIRYLQLMGISDKNNEQESRWARGLMSRPILESENRVKYMLAKNDAMPMWRATGDSIARFGDVTVYRNKFLLPFGYTYKQYIKESVFDKCPLNQKDFISLRACVIKDEEVNLVKGLTEFQLRDTIPQTAFNFDIYQQGINELGKESMVTEKFEDAHISGKINVSENKMLYLSVPYDDGWQLKVDGKPRDKEIVFAGMTGIMLSPGQHTIEMVYELRYFSKGLIMSLLGLVLCVVLWFLLRKNNAPKTIATPV